MIPLIQNLEKALRSRPFQREGIEFADEHRNVPLPTSLDWKRHYKMGAVIESGCTGSILVVAPKTAVYVTWPHELERWFCRRCTV